MLRARQLIDVHGQPEQVLEQERTEDSPWKRQRLQAIRLALEGQETYRRISEIVRCTTASLCQWIGWFRHGGLEELLAHANGAKGGKEPRFNPEQWELFRAQLAQGQWRTARDAQRWLEEELGLKVAGKEVYRHLGKARRAAQGGSPQPRQKRPRRR